MDSTSLVDRAIITVVNAALYIYILTSNGGFMVLMELSTDKAQSEWGLADTLVTQQHQLHLSVAQPFSCHATLSSCRTWPCTPTHPSATATRCSHPEQTCMISTCLKTAEILLRVCFLLRHDLSHFCSLIFSFSFSGMEMDQTVYLIFCGIFSSKSCSTKLHHYLLSVAKFVLALVTPLTTAAWSMFCPSTLALTDNRQTCEQTVP